MSCGPTCAGRAFPRQSPALTPGQRRRLDPLTLTLLRSHAEMLSRERAEFGSGHADSGPLFCWEDGRPVHPDTITSRFRKIVESAGLPKVNLHDVRHSYASVGRDAMIDWKTLSERIGHSDVAFTMRQ